VIPRVLHRIWFGGEMPAEFARYGSRWAELHPGWRIVEWTDGSELFPLRNQRLFDEARELQPGDWKRWRSDVLRLELLWRYGGVYVDTDSEPLRPLSGLLDGVAAFTAYSPHRGPAGERLANNGTMGAEPRHPFFDALIEQLPAWAEAHRGRRTAVAVGPYFISHVLGSAEWPDVAVFEPRVFYPQSIPERDAGCSPNLDGAYTWHRWATTRDRRLVGARP
jgi:mannosyltransferase OCH1-like enzyme